MFTLSQIQHTVSSINWNETATQYASKPLHQVYLQATAHKTYVLAGCIIATIAVKCVHYFMTRPQYPIVGMKTSLNCASLSLKMLEQKAPALRLMMTFCIDTSGSMKGYRENEVKKGIKNVVTSALGEINKQPDATIKITIIGFDTEPRTILNTTKITQETVQAIYDALNYSSTGLTCIPDGIRCALEYCGVRGYKNTFVLLTDGEDSIESTTCKSLKKAIQAKAANFFAIGIGKGHNSETLKSLSIIDNNYIDTTQNGQSITKAIQQVYAKALASFTELRLSSSLPDGTWSINGNRCTTHAYALEDLNEGQSKDLEIVINPSLLKDPTDLRNVSFTLSFKDHRGRTGSMHLPWRPNTIIDPKIIKEIMHI